jgi:hypothetical protein
MTYLEFLSLGTSADNALDERGADLVDDDSACLGGRDTEIHLSYVDKQKANPKETYKNWFSATKLHK